MKNKPFFLCVSNMIQNKRLHSFAGSSHMNRFGLYKTQISNFRSKDILFRHTRVQWESLTSRMSHILHARFKTTFRVHTITFRSHIYTFPLLFERTLLKRLCASWLRFGCIWRAFHRLCTPICQFFKPTYIYNLSIKKDHRITPRRAIFFVCVFLYWFNCSNIWVVAASYI